MLFHKDIKYALCVIKDQKEEWKKMNEMPLHEKKYFFMYKSDSGRDKSLKSFLKKFPKKHIKELKKGTLISLRRKDGEDLPFISVRVNVINSIKFMRLFENNGLQGGTGEQVEKPVKKDKTNYAVKYKKCKAEIQRQISKLSNKELKTFTKNMPLRDKLIKTVHKKVNYPLSTIDGWFIDEVMKNSII